MKRIVLGLEYAGDAFCGWQSQAHGRTVQDVLEAALGRIAAEPVRLHCAGRTDTGVHASVQVVHFDTRAQRPLSAWVRGVNALLPATVVVRWSVEADQDFHARYLATERRYRYILHNAPTRPALLAGRVGWFHLPLDEGRMAEAAACLVGTHDFSSFRAAGCQSKTPVRVMHEARVGRQGDYLLFDFRANGFLHHMIRNLVGALVYVGKGRYPPSWMGELLQARDRSRAAPTFAADGLYLCGVSYPPRWSLPDDGRIIALPQLPLA
ncbi:tRNA pseudouridine(38-40) synthase TruA [Thauera aromatica]|uniref:tRNA pseudouridine synthase A n=1 Tax=Thauera aromatica K172 TaxID=44139 RepID=A0A2R4BLC5_THAAR|nr:tRNA pseudouridine(38-40) synthase TruA [Thauera aromatica]AVR88118.1 tRNA pseudouridine synthase A [Thauera aromatica K172]MCK2095106.1 tRNA pseudouridine(38-40) synthase TruA [Thauera aromatica]